jgi:hypothetical protein
LPRLAERLFSILFGFVGNVPSDATFNPRFSTEEENMKKFGYVIAALGVFAIAAPSIASAEDVVIKRDGDRHGARAEFREHRAEFREHRDRDRGWRHRHDRVVILKHRHHDR